MVLGIGIAKQFLSSLVLGIVLVCKTYYSTSLELHISILKGHIIWYKNNCWNYLNLPFKIRGLGRIQPDVAYNVHPDLLDDLEDGHTTHHKNNVHVPHSGVHQSRVDHSELVQDLT